MRITEEIRSYGSLCSLATGEVNGVEVYESDFVDKYDHDAENAEDYCCGNMVAEIKQPTKEILDKYVITEEEFYAVAEIISEQVSFGTCGWCS